jgi:hypothetical protein
MQLNGRPPGPAFIKPESRALHVVSPILMAVPRLGTSIAGDSSE